MYIYNADFSNKTRARGEDTHTHTQIFAKRCYIKKKNHSALFCTHSYTVSGGLSSVVWTDAVQLVCIAIGLAISAPYAALHPAVSFEKSLMSKDWLGDIRNDDLGEWLDAMLLAIFGGIPWQVKYILFL